MFFYCTMFKTVINYGFMARNKMWPTVSAIERTIYDRFKHHKTPSTYELMIKLNIYTYFERNVAANRITRQPSLLRR